MNPVLIEIGKIKIYWYSVMILIGILLAIMIINKEIKKHNISETKISDMIFYTLIIGMIGARIYYVIFNLEYYTKYPIDIIKIWEGGLAIHGGIIAGTLTMIYYTKKHNLNTLKIFDITVPGLLIGQAIGRWGNFFNQEAYGAITTVAKLKDVGVPDFVINGMYILGEYRQPTFFYESIWNFFGFVALLIIRRYPYLKTGQLSGIYLIWYSILRFIIEGMRTDSLMLGNFKVAQIVSFILLIVGIVLVIYYKYIKKVGPLNNLYNKDEEKVKETQPLFIKQ